MGYRLSNPKSIGSTLRLFNVGDKVGFPDGSTGEIRSTNFSRANPYLVERQFKVRNQTTGVDEMMMELVWVPSGSFIVQSTPLNAGQVFGSQLGDPGPAQEESNVPEAGPGG